jgi:multiple sugar transport system substrate-binding protein
VPSYVRNDPSWNEADVFDLLRAEETRWGRQTYAVPLGSPQLVLYYRADVLRQMSRQPPATWTDLEELLGLLAQRQSGGESAARTPGVPRYLAVQPLAPGWAGQVLLARSAGYARHRGYYSALFDYRTMEPRIDQAPFVRALEELVRCASACPAESLALSPGAARELFLQGQSALALAWPHAGDGRLRKQAIEVGYAELPGSREVFNFGDQIWEMRAGDDPGRIPLLGISGRLASVTRQSPRKRRAFHLLALLSGPQWSGDVASASPATTLFRQSHRADSRRWADRESSAEAARVYTDLAAETQSRKLCLMTLRIPGASRYMAVLDAAVREAVRGEKSPAAALAGAAQAWRQITGELQLEAQRQAYQQSLGL